jgi:hypothetical protein
MRSCANVRKRASNPKDKTPLSCACGGLYPSHAPAGDRRQEENSSDASCWEEVRAARNHDARKGNRGEYQIGPYQPADGRTPAPAVKILEEQQGWNETRKLDQFIDERPNPPRFTEGHLEWGCVRKQSQAIWAGE